MVLLQGEVKSMLEAMSSAPSSGSCRHSTVRPRPFKEDKLRHTVGVSRHHSCTCRSLMGGHRQRRGRSQGVGCGSRTRSDTNTEQVEAQEVQIPHLQMSNGSADARVSITDARDSITDARVSITLNGKVASGAQLGSELRYNGRISHLYPMLQLA